ncbi:MAG: hypothetical protein GY822_28955, partial [Deltaproteobacteria bacterium]|nr:hypothetical protein [Deltaproteobacteria bacterium]
MNDPNLAGTLLALERGEIWVKDTTKFDVFDGVLYFAPFPDVELWRVVVPSQEYTALLFSHHTNICGGHFSFKKTYKQLSNSFYWPRMYQYVLNFCRACPTCAAKKRNSPKAKLDLNLVSLVQRSPDRRANDHSVLPYHYKPKRRRRARAVPNSDATTKTSLSSRLFFPDPLSPAPYHSKVSV